MKCYMSDQVHVYSLGGRPCSCAHRCAVAAPFRVSMSRMYEHCKYNIGESGTLILKDSGHALLFGHVSTVLLTSWLAGRQRVGTRGPTRNDRSARLVSDREYIG